MTRLKIEIRDFRAIARASIDLESITVLAGVNASGKSTISRAMFYCGYFANHYEYLLQPAVRNSLLPTMHFLISTPLVTINQNSYRKTLEILVSQPDVGVLVALAQCRDAYSATSVTRLDRERLGKVLRRQIVSRKAFFDGLEELEGQIKDAIARYHSQAQQRSRDALSVELCNQFRIPKVKLLDKITISEGENVVIGGGREDVGFFTSLDSVFYLDSPMLLSLFSNLNDSEVELLHWQEILKVFAFTREDSITLTNPASRELMADVEQLLGGSVKSVESAAQIASLGQVLFEDQSQRRIVLSEMATGMKSFIILQRLLQKGLLNDKTLLIIDEPEAHLHPQWVVEYARILLEIHSKLGTRILVASHSTDFVQSIANIAATTPNVVPPTFYLSYPSSEREGKYEFRDTQGDIEPIFEVFNKSYDRMLRYTDPAHDGE